MSVSAATPTIFAVLAELKLGSGVLSPERVDTVFVGGGTILAAASANTILQTIVDDRLRGRVASFYTLAFLGFAPLGNLAAGALAGALGAPFTFALNGIVAMVAAVWFGKRLPMVRDVLRPIYEQLGVPRRRG